jgi:hypothetical protein
MNTEPLTKSQIFSLLWMLLIGFYLFTGPRNFTVSTEISFLLVGLTVFALWTLGRRFPMFGLFLLMLISSLMSGGRGRRRRW